MSARNPVSLEWLINEFIAKEWRAIKLISNQLPRPSCAIEDNEGQTDGQACATICPQTDELQP